MTIVYAQSHICMPSLLIPVYEDGSKIMARKGTRVFFIHLEEERPISEQSLFVTLLGQYVKDTPYTHNNAYACPHVRW